MKKTFQYLFLSNILLLALTMHTLAEGVSKVPWMVFTYGIPGLAVLAIIIPLIQHLVSKGGE